LNIRFGSYSPAEVAMLAALGSVVGGVGVLVWWFIRKPRVSPDERERRRRLLLSAGGKMGDATIMDIKGNLVFYSYNVRGIGYQAWQDVSALKDQLGDPESVAGPVAIKYDARNPANSIVIAEGWSGIRRS
jgi:hypothetical protein